MTELLERHPQYQPSLKEGSNISQIQWFYISHLTWTYVYYLLFTGLRYTAAFITESPSWILIFLLVFYTLLAVWLDLGSVKHKFYSIYQIEQAPV